MLKGLSKLLLISLLFTIGACTSLTGSQTTKNTPIISTSLLEQVVTEYFNVYQHRTDFEKFLTFYHEDAVLEDVVYGNLVKSKKEIKTFLNWQDPNFSLIDKNNALVVQKQVIQGNTVVTEGYFTEFNYYGKKLGPWRFIILLEFNDELKIIRQVDWINYTPREQYLGGKNMNELLLK